MKKTLSVALVMLVLCTLCSAHAALIDRGNGMIYDTDLNITWLKDANYPYTSGSVEIQAMTWNDAMTWVANLNYRGITGWRLPTTPLGTLSQSEQYRTPGQGEMGHLYNNDGINGGSPGPFINLTISTWGSDNARFYWTSTTGPDSFGAQTAVIFNFSSPNPGWWGGYEILYDRSIANATAWAVHDGDVGATLPPTPLEGTWYFQVYGDSPSTNAPYWGSGTMILDADGAVTGETAINDSGTTKALTGGSLTIDSAGQVAGTVTLSDNSTETLPHGKLDAGKSILTMVNSDTAYRGLLVAIKGGGAFTQQDLAGTWYYEVFFDNPTTNAPTWGYGTMMLDAGGTVTSGTTTNSDGYTDTLVGGSLAIDSAGLVSGTVLQANGIVQSLPHGKLDKGKNFLAMVKITGSLISSCGKVSLILFVAMLPPCIIHRRGCKGHRDQNLEF